MIGHELTAFHGLDHAQTLAIVLPNLLWVLRDSKREKLIQFAERVWDVKAGTPEARLEEGIIRTRAFFESMGNPTHLSAYGIESERFVDIIARLEKRGALPLGERQALSAEKLQEILTMAR
jgi:NADP-dependent alcohol dehydrogenase